MSYTGPRGCCYGMTAHADTCPNKPAIYTEGEIRWAIKHNTIPDAPFIEEMPEATTETMAIDYYNGILKEVQTLGFRRERWPQLVRAELVWQVVE
jgi:hypothetical protein